MSTLKVDTLQNVAGVQKYLSQSWLNINGTGTLTILSSGNISSVTDLGTGLYRSNFSSAISTSNYSATVTGLSVSTTEASRIMTIRGTIGTGPSLKTTSSLEVLSGYGWSGGRLDCANVSITIVAQ